MGGADEAYMRKGLRKISQMFALVAKLLRIQPEVIGISKHLFKIQAGRILFSCP